MSDNERKFREMWNWIADETRRQKRRVEKFECYIAFGIPKRERPYCDCYACEEARQRACDDHNCGIMCNYCPIDWGKCGCTEEGTLFYNWGYAHLYEDAARFAEKIARLAWKDKCERATEKTREMSKPPEEETVDCLFCGGEGTMKGYRAKVNGHFHGKCEKCGAVMMS